MNISKDDALAWPERVHRSVYPEPVEQGIPNVVRPFVEKSLEVNQTILDIFNDKLGLPEKHLSQLHPLDARSGSEARILRNPPMPHNTHKRAIGAHTDFGSLVSLFNINLKSQMTNFNSRSFTTDLVDFRYSLQARKLGNTSR